MKNSWVPGFDASDLRKTIGVEVGGVLGLAPFMNGTMEIDLANQRLVLRKGRLRDTAGDTLVPLIVHRRNPEVPVQIADQVHNFKIDTGSNGCLSVTRACAKRLSFRPGSESRSLAVGTAWTGQREAARLAVPVWLGSHQITNAEVSWFEDAPGKFLLGKDILRHFVVELDFVHAVARFSRESEGPIEIPDAWTLNLNVRTDPKGGLPRVFGGSPSDSDGNLWLRDGDVVESINGQSTKGLPQEDLDRLLELKDTLVLRVDRKGTIMEVRITQR